MLKTDSLGKVHHEIIAHPPVGDIDATVSASLQSAEHTSASGGAHETDVKVTAEGARLTVDVLDIELVSIYLRLTCICTVQVQLFQQLSNNHMI